MIHATAVVDSRAEIGSDVEIGPFCVVGPHVKIGKRTKLLSHVVIDGWTTLGEDNVIFPFSVIGGAPQDLKYKGEKTELIIGHRNTIRESVTISLGTVQGGGRTVVGNDNLLMATVHLGHDCIIGNSCILANGVGLAGHATIEDFANLGGMCGVGQFVRVGAYCYVAGKSGVDRDVPPFSIVIGSRPCEMRGANIVGLKRRGFSTDVIQKISEAIKLWSRSSVSKDECLQEIEANLGEIAEVQEFVQFIRKSENGVVR